ncbi:MAG: DUF899 family protein [Deltaproteobacteria bacterium]
MRSGAVGQEKARGATLAPSRSVRLHAKDLGILDDKGNEGAAIVIYQRKGDEVRLFYAAEMPAEAADPGQDPRTAPDIAPLWSLLDLTPEGRDPHWYPKLSY